MSEHECLHARQTVDDTSAFSAEQLLAAEQHIRNCAPCETWRSQVNVLATAAREMTFFDVPEALTQRIMADVQETSSSSALSVRTLILSCVVIVASVCVFSFESFDTVDGVISWMVGFVMLFGLKYLLQVKARNDARFQNQN